MSTGAAVAAASCPPLIADRCLRTVFSASMSAPASSRRPVVSRLSASVRPDRRHGHQRGGAAGEQHEQPVVGGTGRAPARARAGRPRRCARRAPGGSPIHDDQPGGSVGRGAGPIDQPVDHARRGRASRARPPSAPTPCPRRGREPGATRKPRCSGDGQGGLEQARSRATRRGPRGRSREDRGGDGAMREVSSPCSGWTTRTDSSRRRIA